MSVTNSTIFQAAKLSGTSDYQQMIDKLSQGTLRGTAAADYFFAQPAYLRNQFVDFLVNRIGTVVVKRHQFNNPLAALKRGSLQYGSTVEMTALDYIKSREWLDTEPDPGDERAALFGTFRPEGKVAFATVNTRRVYPITVNETELRQAFVADNGLSDFVASIMEIPNNSDQYSEYILMKQVLANYDEANPGVLYRKTYDINGFPNDAASSSEFLKDLRVYAEKLRFPNQARLYTPGDMPGTYGPSDLTLLTTPEVLASIDVDKLAMVFNISRADIRYSTVVVDEFPIPGVFAALVANDAWCVYDQVYENTSQYNPLRLSTNYFLHHWQIMALNPFHPVILFQADKDIDGVEIAYTPTREATTITETATGVRLSAKSPTVERGGTDELALTIQGTLTASPEGRSINPNITVSPASATFEVSAKSGDDDVELNSRTYVDAYTGILHVQKSSLKSGDVITVTATGTYQNPTSATADPATPYTATVEVTVE